MIKIILFFLLVSIQVAIASPLKLEMIFLSPQKIAQLLEMIDKNELPNMLNNSRGYLAETDDQLKNCVPMGDGCFHPQLGYIDQKPMIGERKKTATVNGEYNLQTKTFNSTDVSLVNCDKDYHFDIFCGKEKRLAATAEIEIWFDISSSLRTVDFSKDSMTCNRRLFMSKVMQGCKEKVKVSVYNTSLKEVGDFSSVCLAYGTNDEKNLLKWMRASEAKLLVIVTDVDELSMAMKEFLSERGAKMTGDGVKPFSSTNLVDYANDFIKMCKK